MQNLSRIEGKKDTEGIGEANVESTEVESEKQFVRNDEKNGDPEQKDEAEEKKEAAATFWGRTLLLLVFSVGPIMAFGLLFTDIGYGGTVHKALRNIDPQITALLVLIMIFFFLGVYCLDFSSWNHSAKMFVNSILFLCLGTIAVMLAGIYPVFPILLFLILVPVYFWMIFRVLHDCTADKKNFLVNYLESVSVAVGLSGLASMIVWIVWVSQGNWWNTELRHLFRKEMMCTEEYCMAAFLLWCGHPIAAIIVMIFAFLSYILSKSIGVTSSTKSNHKLHFVVKIFLFSFVFLLIGTWVAASIGGSKTGMANLVLVCSFSGGIFAVLIVGSIYGWSQLAKDLQESPKFRKMYGWLLSDWILALGALMLFPPLLLFLLLSAGNNCIRQCKDKKAKKDKTLFTERVNKNIEMLWIKRNSTSILTKLILLGLGLIIVQVVLGKFVNVFLSWVLSQLASLDELYAQTLIFVFIGLSMFLVPAIPGGPVYIAGGVLLVDPSWKAFAGGGEGYKSNEGAFWLACLYSSVVCLVIKFLAIAFEQKVIGERLGAKVAVRSFVGVNTMFTRAMKKILEQDGLHVDKVSILVGGPDWPTSVITGILKLNLWQMLLGSFPVFIFYIIPSVIAGGFMLRPDPPYNTIQPIVLSIAGGLNIAGPSLAVYYLEKTTNAHWDELSKIPPDEEVLKLEQENFKKLALNKGWNMWEGLQYFQKMLLIVSSLSMICSVWIFFAFGSSSFSSFEVTDTLAKKFGPGSIAFDIVKVPLGWIGIGLLIFSVLNYKIFNWLRERNVEHTLKKFDLVEAENKFKALYQDSAKTKYSEYNGERPTVTIKKTMRSSIVDLIYKIMDDVLRIYLTNSEYDLPIKDLNNVLNWNLSKTKLRAEIEKPDVNFMVESILRDGAEKVIDGLRSKKDWVEEAELISEKIENDFAVVMAAEFSVIIHILKRKIRKLEKSASRAQLPIEEGQMQIEDKDNKV